jgi:hypothetical protein
VKTGLGPKTLHKSRSPNKYFLETKKKSCDQKICGTPKKIREKNFRNAKKGTNKNFQERKKQQKTKKKTKKTKKN